MHNFGAIINPAHRRRSRRTASRASSSPRTSRASSSTTPASSPTPRPSSPTRRSPPTARRSRNSSGSTRTASRSGSSQPDCHTCFRIEDYELIQVKTDRIGGDIRLSYDITPNLSFSIDEKLLQREIYDFNQPSISFFSFLPPPDNAFITPAIQTAINNSAARRGLREPLPRRRRRRARRSRGGSPNAWFRMLQGNFDAQFAQINWDAEYNFGESTELLQQPQHPVAGQLRRLGRRGDRPGDRPAGLPHQCALRPAGPVQRARHGPCRHPASACVPYNPFGLQNSKAAIRYSRVTTNEYQRLSRTSRRSTSTSTPRAS